MQATKAALPVSIYHRLVDGEATMRVKLLGAIKIRRVFFGVNH